MSVLDQPIRYVVRKAFGLLVLALNQIMIQDNSEVVEKQMRYSPDLTSNIHLDNIQVTKDNIKNYKHSILYYGAVYAKILLRGQAQSSGAVEYTNCTSAVGYDPPSPWVSWIGHKLSDGEALVLELWGMLNTPSLPLLPSPLWPRVVAPDRVLSKCQIELFNI